MRAQTYRGRVGQLLEMLKATIHCWELILWEMGPYGHYPDDKDKKHCDDSRNDDERYREALLRLYGHVASMHIPWRHCSASCGTRCASLLWYAPLLRHGSALRYRSALRHAGGRRSC